VFPFLSTRTVSFRKVGILSEVPTSDKKAERCGVDGPRVADLSRPYHKGVPDGKLFSTEYTVRWSGHAHSITLDSIAKLYLRVSSVSHSGHSS
jgi:hypothetical protein